jgi:hypothetical protein
LALRSAFKSGTDLAARQVAAVKTAVDRPHLPVTDSDEDLCRFAAEINDGDVGFQNVHTFQGLAADKNNEA